MANILIQSPFEYLTDRNGRALANGKIYIGEPNKDPENFPVAAFFDVDGTVPAPQPIRTNSAGFPCDASGNPQRIFTATAYSIRVSDQNDAQVYYAADAADGFFGVIASELANNTDPALGSGLVGYVYETGATGTTVHDKFNRIIVDVKDFGAIGDGLANDKAAFDEAAATGRSILLPAGSYNVPSGNYSSSRFYSFDGATCTNSTVAIVDPLANSLAVGTEASFPCVEASLPFGWVALHGQTLNRAVYPQLWEFANTSGNIVDEVDKPSNPGAFGRGNGTTTFSLPDKRGTNQGFADASRGLDATFALGKLVTVTAASAAPGISVHSTISTPAVRAFAGAVNQGSIDIQALQTQVTANTNGMLRSAVAVTASGTSIDFLSIPANAKRITMVLSGISTNGTSPVIVRIGSGSIDTTGYLGSSTTYGSSTISTELVTNGFKENISYSAAAARHGIVSLIQAGSNNWVCTAQMHRSDAAQGSGFSGSRQLSGGIDRIRLTTVSGTDTFDAGVVNVMWEVGS